MTSDSPLDERYLIWLYAQIGPVRNNNPARSHWLMAEQLYKMEFAWFVPNDDNRIADGIQLREEFIDSTSAERDQEWLSLGCSMLEMLIALSRRAEFESAHDSFYWFWRMIDNLKLLPFTDDHYDDETRMIVADTFEVMASRQYRRDGVGGLFPLRRAREDQREVEIWYQLAAYLLENGYE